MFTIPTASASWPASTARCWTRPASGSYAPAQPPGSHLRIIRRLAALLAGAGAVPGQAPGTVWAARPHPLGEPGGRAQIIPVRPVSRRN
jgi:hypothetical protein